MILLCDVGNSFTKLKLYDDGSFLDISEPNLRNVISLVSKVVMSSVSTAEKTFLTNLSNLQYSGPIIEAKVQDQYKGVKCAYSKVGTLGIDRWLGVIAAASLWPNQNCLIVDAGTAITIDGLTKNKQHLGGLILPGLHLMESSIIDKAPGVFSTSDATVVGWPNNTQDALRTGCVRSAVSNIEYTHRLHLPDAKVILTGGDADALSAQLSLPHVIDHNLIFKGLFEFS